MVDIDLGVGAGYGRKHLSKNVGNGLGHRVNDHPQPVEAPPIPLLAQPFDGLRKHIDERVHIARPQDPNQKPPAHVEAAFTSLADIDHGSRHYIVGATAAHNLTDEADDLRTISRYAGSAHSPPSGSSSPSSVSTVAAPIRAPQDGQNLASSGTSAPQSLQCSTIGSTDSNCSL